MKGAELLLATGPTPHPTLVSSALTLAGKIDAIMWTQGAYNLRNLLSRRREAGHTAIAVIPQPARSGLPVDS